MKWANTPLNSPSICSASNPVSTLAFWACTCNQLLIQEMNELLSFKVKGHGCLLRRIQDVYDFPMLVGAQCRKATMEWSQIMQECLSGPSLIQVFYGLFRTLPYFFFINCVVIYIRLPNLLNVKRNDELKSTILPLKANLLNVSLRNAITVLECVVCYKSKLEIFGSKLKIAMVPSHVIQRG